MWRSCRLLVCLLPLGAAGCNPADPFGQAAREGRQLASADLFDPASAQFREAKVNRASDGLYFCAEMNAKNRYGAYVGFKRVLVSLAEKKTMIEPDEPNSLDTIEGVTAGYAKLNFDVRWSIACGADTAAAASDASADPASLEPMEYYVPPASAGP